MGIEEHVHNKCFNCGRLTEQPYQLSPLMRLRLPVADPYVPNTDAFRIKDVMGLVTAEREGPNKHCERCSPNDNQLHIAHTEYKGFRKDSFVFTKYVRVVTMEWPIVVHRNPVTGLGFEWRIRDGSTYQGVYLMGALLSLQSFVVTDSGNHYFCYTRCADGEWRVFDDNKCEQAPET